MDVIVLILAILGAIAFLGPSIGFPLYHLGRWLLDYPSLIVTIKECHFCWGDGCSVCRWSGRLSSDWREKIPPELRCRVCGGRGLVDADPSAPNPTLNPSKFRSCPECERTGLSSGPPQYRET